MWNSCKTWFERRITQWRQQSWRELLTPRIGVSTRIRNKLVVSMLGVALIPALSLGVAMYTAFKSNALLRSYERLQTVETLKVRDIESHFQLLQQQIVSLAENHIVQQALSELPGAMRIRASTQSQSPQRQQNRVNSERLRELLFDRHLHIMTTESLDDAAFRDALDQLDETALVYQVVHVPEQAAERVSPATVSDVSVPAEYGRVHQQVHDDLHGYLERFQIADLCLVDVADERVVYSARKACDFASSLNSGPFAGSGLAEAGRAALRARTAAQTAFSDFAPYLPAGNAPVAFLAAPVISEGRVLGAVVFQLRFERIATILSQSSGISDATTSLLVGPDGRPRTGRNPVVEEQRTQQFDSTLASLPMVNEALKGHRGRGEWTDGRNENVLTCWSPVTVHRGSQGLGEDVRWAMLTNMDRSEVDAPIRAMFWRAVLTGYASIVFVVGVSYLLAKSLTRQTDEITQVLKKIDSGIYDARASVLTCDELGAVAQSLNAMCDNTLSLIQSREERDQIRRAARRLQREVSAVASGDLTVSAEVTEDLTGEIAASVNHMVSQLRTIVEHVQSASELVSRSARELQARTEKLIIGTESQAAQVVGTSERIDHMASSIHDVSANTSRSAEVAVEARENAARGARAVQDTIEGMNRIRQQVQGCSKRIKGLGETSQKVGAIVQVIEDIADRTSILALNASIQAAMAGEAGHGFGVVAEEVEQLAKRCNQATSQISLLIQDMQDQTAEAILAMEESTREVVNGSELATQAGTALDEIDDVSVQLAALIKSISEAALQQAHGAEAISESMGVISDVTQQTAEGTRDAAEAVSGLARLADELNESISQFKLGSHSPQKYRADEIVSDAERTLACAKSLTQLVHESIVARLAPLRTRETSHIEQQPTEEPNVPAPSIRHRPEHPRNR